MLFQFFALFFFGFLPLAFAEAEGWQPAFWLQVVRLIGGLLLIVPLIYLAVRYWSKSQVGGSGVIEVLDRVMFAQGKTLNLVRVGDEVFLLAASEQGLELLKIYQGEEARAFIRQKRESRESAVEFERILERQLEKLRNLQKKQKGPRE